MASPLTSKKRRPVQTAYNAARAVRRKIGTLQIIVGETPHLKVLTMATGGPRRSVAARVVRESDWRALMEVVCAAWHASPISPSGRELLIADSIHKLKTHLEKRRGR